MHEYIANHVEEYTGTLEDYASEILRVARMFEAYSCGDLDAQAAEMMAAA